MADSNQDPSDGSLDPIEAQVERDRAELVSTVEALRRRITTTSDGRARPLSAGALRSEVGRYAAERRRGMVSGAVSGLEQRLRDHPLETVAVAAGAAYPLVRLVSRIPVPILLMGAGVALAGRGGSADRRSDGGATVVEGEAYAVESAAPLREPRVSTLVGDETGIEPDRGAEARSRPPLVETAKERAARLAQGATDSAARLAQGATQAYREGTGAVARAGRTGGETLAEAIQRRPAAAAGVSLLIGGALAMMLPRSRAEERLLGEASEEVRARARALASEGLESGRKVVEAVQAEAAHQGLTPEEARRAIGEVGARARKAVDDIAEDAGRAIGSGDADTSKTDTSKAE